MADYVLSDATRDKLKRISTASIATQLYKRGLRNQFIQGVAPLSDKAQTELRRFLKLGGFLLIDDPQAQPEGPFEPSVVALGWVMAAALGGLIAVMLYHGGVDDASPAST